MKHRLLAAASTIALLFPAIGFAYSDVPTTSPVYPAAEYLKSKGIVQDSEKFNPNENLTRAQAAKVLVAPLVSAEELKKITSSQFSDVPSGQWFTPYVEAARVLGLVDTAPSFNPSAPVTKAAFIKMLTKSKKLNYDTAFSDFKQPFSKDVSSASEWYYPIMRYALATSMTAIGSDGMLGPAQNITRGQMALLYYRLEMYQSGRRTQALLSQAETEIGNVLQMIQQKSVSDAEWAASRSVIAARGALAARPNEAIVKGAMKVSEGFQYLVQGYRAGVEGRLDDAIARAKDAYNSADKARTFTNALNSIAEQMQTLAKNMADEARAAKAQQ